LRSKAPALGLSLSSIVPPVKRPLDAKTTHKNVPINKYQDSHSFPFSQVQYVKLLLYVVKG